MGSLVVLVTAHTEKERTKWAECIVDMLLGRVKGVSIYDGHGAFLLKDRSRSSEPHYRLEVYEEDHKIHKLYSWIYPTLQQYLLEAKQECVLVLMNGNMSLVYLE